MESSQLRNLLQSETRGQEIPQWLMYRHSRRPFWTCLWVSPVSLIRLFFWAGGGGVKKLKFLSWNYSPQCWIIRISDYKTIRHQITGSLMYILPSKYARPLQISMRRYREVFYLRNTAGHCLQLHCITQTETLKVHTAPDCISHVTRHISYDGYAEYRIHSKCGVNLETSLQNFENLWWNISHWGQYTWKTSMMHPYKTNVVQKLREARLYLVNCTYGARCRTRPHIHSD